LLITQRTTDPGELSEREVAPGSAETVVTPAVDGSEYANGFEAGVAQ
jgi:hypothetical protein